MIEEEISKKVTKKIEKTNIKLNKLLNKIDTAYNRLNEVIDNNFNEFGFKGLTANQLEKVLRMQKQLAVLKKQIKKLEAVAEKNKNIDKEKINRENIKQLEKDFNKEIKQLNKTVKLAIDDSTLRTVLRDVGIISLYTLLSAGPIGLVLGIYNVNVAHHNRKNKKYEDLQMALQEEVNYFPY